MAIRTIIMIMEELLSGRVSRYRSELELSEALRVVVVGHDVHP